MEIFKLFGSILIDSSEAQNSISKTEEKAESLGSKLTGGIKTAAKWGAAVVAGATAVGGAMVAAAKSTAETLDVVDKASQRMNISAEAYQELAYAADLSGVSMSTLEKAAKSLIDTDMTLDEALDQIMQYGTEAERTAAAVELFGEKVAYDMTPLLKSGAEGLSAMKQEANDLGLVMSQDTVSAGAELNDMFTKVEQSTAALKAGLMSELMPYVMDILGWLIANIPEIQKTVHNVMEAIMPIVKPVLEAVQGALEMFISLINGDIDGFVEGFKKVFEGLATAALTLGENIMSSLWNGLKNIWNSIKDWVTEKTEWIKDKLTFWKKSSDGDEEVSGRHASGLPFVPYDGYTAELHRGETVLNAGSTQDLLGAIKSLASNSSSRGDISLNLTVELDGATLSRKMYKFNAAEDAARGSSLVGGTVC